MTDGEYFMKAKQHCACVACVTIRGKESMAHIWAGPTEQQPPPEQSFSQIDHTEQQAATHLVDGVTVPCDGEERCACCLILKITPSAFTPSSWPWYAAFLLEYATREAWACKQKLQEYGFNLQDVFTPIRAISLHERATWWRTWLVQGYFRHGSAIMRLIDQEPVLHNAEKSHRKNLQWLHRRIADIYGYASIGMAKLRLEKE